jgi:hypothetical protein
MYTVNLYVEGAFSHTIQTEVKPEFGYEYQSPDDITQFLKVVSIRPKNSGSKEMDVYTQKTRGALIYG